MKNSARVIVNTLAQYLRTIITALISLYTSRIVLQYLGVSDYGINDLIAGVIALFSFINSTLAQTTQRYLSFYQGKHDFQMCRIVFNNSVLTQFFLALILCVVLLALTNPIFNHLLNIEKSRLSAAHTIYYFMIVSLFFNLMTTPYFAALIAHENIVYSSIVQILDSVLKLPVAFSLMWVFFDKLEWYGLCNFVIVLLNFFLYFFYARKYYIECQSFSIKSFERRIFKEMFSFLGWTLYGTACVVGRSRGLAIIVNRFFSAAINGAMGIGSQISNQLSFLSSSLTTALRPQIIKAEGAGEREKMIHLTEMCCKFSLLLLLMISIPFVVEMDNVMNVWLYIVPPYSIFFARAWVISQVVDQMTVGLTIANAAVGNVKNYNVVTNTVKILALPVIYVFLKFDYPIETTMYIYIMFEFICSLIRLIYMKHNLNLSILSYMKNVILPVFIPLLITLSVCLTYKKIFSYSLFFVGNFFLSFLIMGFTSYFLSLNKNEREHILMMLAKIKINGKKNRD